MWHVDEGTLQAFLDDRERGPAAGALDAETRDRVAAHLHACDVCSAELQRAERLRARAAGILLAAAPEIETPPFDLVAPQLTPRAPTMRPARARPAWLPLAWAASVLLAVGAGWMGSQLWRGGAGSDARREQAAASPESTAPAQTAAAPAQTPALARADTAPAPPAPGGGMRGAERWRADAAAPAGEAAGGVGGVVLSAEAKQLQPAAAAREPAERRAVAAADLAVTAEKAAAGNLAGGAAERARVSAVSAAAAPAAGLTAAPRPAPGVVAEAGAGGYPGDADVAWEISSREAAERLLGERINLVADAAVQEIAVAPRAQPALVRVRQVTAAGPVELLQWRAPAPAVDALRALPAAPPPAATGFTRDGGRFVTVPGTTHPVLLRTAADVDPAGLLARVRPAR
ncbi:MAG: hypothetical protein FIB01_11780 [Gemmatimonadetes bacterium]|nr:hypothetical protein [Gemmatimonadota bacterium]